MRQSADWTSSTTSWTRGSDSDSDADSGSGSARSRAPPTPTPTRIQGLTSATSWTQSPSLSSTPSCAVRSCRDRATFRPARARAPRPLERVVAPSALAWNARSACVRKCSPPWSLPPSLRAPADDFDPFLKTFDPFLKTPWWRSRSYDLYTGFIHRIYPESYFSRRFGGARVDMIYTHDAPRIIDQLAPAEPMQKHAASLASRNIADRDAWPGTLPFCGRSKRYSRVALRRFAAKAGDGGSATQTVVTERQLHDRVRLEKLPSQTTSKAGPQNRCSTCCRSDSRRRRQGCPLRWSDVRVDGGAVYVTSLHCYY